jgi:hypothetical protein
MKKYSLDGCNVKVVKELQTKDEKQIVDKAGSWVQIQYLDGPQKGNKN